MLPIWRVLPLRGKGAGKPGVPKGIRPGYPRSNRFGTPNVSKKLRDSARKDIGSRNSKQLKNKLFATARFSVPKHVGCGTALQVIAANPGTPKQE
jgi:hypothetical protein